jgi:hypothetical protein
VTAVGGCATVVAGALVVANVHNAGQRVTIRPAAQGGPVAGTIFVANEGDYGGGTGPGSITFYRPGASGNARPEGTITKGVDGPSGFAFDSSGDLWVANGTGTVVEYSRADVATASPVPTAPSPTSPGACPSTPQATSGLATTGGRRWSSSLRQPWADRALQNRLKLSS